MSTDGSHASEQSSVHRAGDGAPDGSTTAARDHVPLSRRGFVQASAGAGVGALGFGGLPGAGAQSSAAPGMAPGGATDYDVAEALQKSLYFFDANMCGEDVSEESRLVWRGDCHDEHDTAVPLDAGPDEHGTNMSSSFIDQHRDLLDPDGTGTVDVAGGYHDAGDHVRFGMPQGFAASTVAWAVHEFEAAFREVGSYDHAIHHLRRFADCFVKSTFRNDAGEVVTFCHQVGDGGSGYDHNYWGPAELQTTDVSTRPAYFATPNEPASDECAAAAAALAAIADVLQGEDDDAASEYLDNAEALYQFALDNRGLGQYAPPHYESGGDEDDLAWAALWLHVATGDDAYLEECVGREGDSFTGHVSSFVQQTSDEWRNTWVHSWDDVRSGLILKLAQVTDDQFWWDMARWHLEYWTGGEVEHQGSSGNYVDTTPAGFSWRNKWGSARYNAAAQFEALVYHKYRQTDHSQAIAEWAIGQMEYIMGDSPMGYSLIVGFTEDHAEHPHHDTAHGSAAGVEDEPPEHRHTLWGALVGGPAKDDTHTDETSDYIENEVAIDFNAGLVGALAGHYEFFGGDGTTVSPFPPEVDHRNPYGVEAELSSVDSGRIDVSAYPEVMHFWPARYETGLSMRYFLSLGDGASASDVSVETTYDQIGSQEGEPVEIVGPEPYDGDGATHFVEFDYSGTNVHGSFELSFALSAYGVDGFDATTDYSHDGIPSSRGATETLPLYVDGELVFGVEPDGTTPEDGGQAPAAPGGLTTSVTSSSIELSWSSVDGASSYEVYRGGSQVDSTSSTSYEFTGLSADTEYAVGVRSVGDAGTSSVAETTATTASGPSCEDSVTVDGRTICNVDDDAYYEDFDGDGSLSQTDVVEFFQVQHREAYKQPDLFDFSGNGDVGHGDVVALFEQATEQLL